MPTSVSSGRSLAADTHDALAAMTHHVHERVGVGQRCKKAGDAIR